jgi:hypothetical protein
MIRHIVKLTVQGAKAKQFYDFMINPSDQRYSEWWQPYRHNRKQFQRSVGSSGMDNGRHTDFDECNGYRRDFDDASDDSGQFWRCSRTV